MIVYKVTNLINGKIYIGKTAKSLARRKACHLAEAKRDEYISAFHRGIRKYGFENFVWEIIDQCLFAESLSILEKYYIEHFNCKTPNGYNLTDGGEGCYGRKCSIETKKKIGASSKGRNVGRIHSEEEKRKMSISMKGIKRSLGTRLKMSVAAKNRTPEHTAKLSAALRGKQSSFLGRKHSPETIAKMSAIAKARGNNGRWRGHVAN